MILILAAFIAEWNEAGRFIKGAYAPFLFPGRLEVMP
jgi:hypothetical protein